MLYARPSHLSAEFVQTLRRYVPLLVIWMMQQRTKLDSLMAQLPEAASTARTTSRGTCVWTSRDGTMVQLQTVPVFQGGPAASIADPVHFWCEQTKFLTVDAPKLMVDSVAAPAKGGQFGAGADEPTKR